MFLESSEAAKRAKELDRIAKDQEQERVRAEAAAEHAAAKIVLSAFEVETVEQRAVGKLKGRGRQASKVALKSLSRVASAASTAASTLPIPHHKRSSAPAFVCPYVRAKDLLF